VPGLEPVTAVAYCPREFDHRLATLNLLIDAYYILK
jgi:hypothetical protein